MDYEVARLLWFFERIMHLIAIFFSLEDVFSIICWGSVFKN